MFALRENAHCQLYFSLTEENALLGVDALAQPWPNVLLYAFPPLSLISPTLTRVRDQGLSLILIAPRWPSKHWIAEIVQLLSGQPCCCAGTSRLRPGRHLPPPSRAGGSMDLACERLNLGAVRLPQSVIDTIQCARASSIHSLYSCKWQVFEWCEARCIVSFQCSVKDTMFSQRPAGKG